MRPRRPRRRRRARRARENRSGNRSNESRIQTRRTTLLALLPVGLSDRLEHYEVLNGDGFACVQCTKKDSREFPSLVNVERRVATATTTQANDKTWRGRATVRELPTLAARCSLIAARCSLIGAAATTATSRPVTCNLSSSRFKEQTRTLGINSRQRLPIIEHIVVSSYRRPVCAKLAVGTYT